MDTIVKYKWTSVALVGLIFLILTHMSQFLHIDKEWSLVEDIGYKFSDEIWIAAFISIIVAFVLDKAAHDKINNIIKNALGDEVAIIDGILQKVLSNNNRILKETEKSIERSQESVFIAAFVNRSHRTFSMLSIGRFLQKSFIALIPKVTGDFDWMKYLESED